MTIDPKFQAKSRERATATVSVCLTPAELESARVAARLSSLSVSAWGAARLAASLQTDRARAAVKAVAEHLAGDGVERDARASMILLGEAHAELRKRAVELGITAHAFVQAVFTASAEVETAAASTEALEAARTAVASGGMIRGGGRGAASKAVVAMVPDAVLQADAAALSAIVAQLLEAAIVRTFQGHGPEMKAGMERLVAKLPAERHPLALAVDPVLLKACAMVLTVEPAALASALAVKAARAL